MSEEKNQSNPLKSVIDGIKGVFDNRVMVRPDDRKTHEGKYVLPNYTTSIQSRGEVIMVGQTVPEWIRPQMRILFKNDRALMTVVDSSDDAEYLIISVEDIHGEVE